MNKSELIAAAAENAGITKKDAERLFGALLDVMAARLSEGEKIQISGFGIFEVQHRKARMGRNPVTREAVEIPAARVPVFKPSKNLKEIVGK